MSPAYGISGSLQVFNKRQYTSPDKIRNTQKLDTSVERNLPGDQDSVSIFRKVISCELSHGSGSDIYVRCWMDLGINIVQTEAPKFCVFGDPGRQHIG